MSEVGQFSSLVVWKRWIGLPRHLEEMFSLIGKLSMLRSASDQSQPNNQHHWRKKDFHGYVVFICSCSRSCLAPSQFFH
jgi:hypothetical protein